MSWKVTLLAILGGYAALLVAVGTYFLWRWLGAQQSFLAPIWFQDLPVVAIPISAFFVIPTCIGVLLGFQWPSDVCISQTLNEDCYLIAWFWSVGLGVFSGVATLAFNGKMGVDNALKFLFAAFLLGTGLALVWAPIIARTIPWGIDFKHRRLADELSGKWSRGEK